MGIPVAMTYSASVGGQTIKKVSCESCGTAYVYQVERIVTGTGTSVLFLDNEGARQRAQDDAIASLGHELAKAVDEVPCPHCGWLQLDMCKRSRKRLFIILLVASLLIASPMFFIGRLSTHDWLVPASIVVFVGGTLASLIGYMIYNPNRKHPGLGEIHLDLANGSKGIFEADFDAVKAAAQANGEQLFQTVLFSWLVRVALADGRMDQSETMRIHEVFSKITGIVLAPQELSKKIARESMGIEPLLRSLKALRFFLNDQTKAMLITAGLYVARNNEKQLAVVDQGAAALEVTADQLKEYLK